MNELAKPAWDFITQLLADVWTKYGPFAALLIIGVMWHEFRMHRLWSNRLDDKDKEIERLVGERNKLQDAILGERQSSKKEKKNA